MGIEKGQVLPLGQIEVRADQTIQVRQQVAVEGRCHAQFIVISRLQHIGRFDQIDPDQQAAILAGFMGLLQKNQGLRRREIADARARVKQDARPAAGLQRQGQRA